ncbi:tail fiber domain-containing protein [Pseudofulvibacter geojedonensis]|uniref:Tail fiber domain-containing protein n=1 Tax=Pseudofulvibacter geojedonensis TaxID=1123758 RepID=A0ABW3I1I7_9FLAO
MIRTHTLKLITSVFIFAFNSGIAQVGIGTTTPHASSSLEISSTNSGLLIPRISIPNVNNTGSTINTPATSLLVYNTNAGITGGSGTGFYYWDGSEWVKLETRPSSDWTLLGNTGTNANVNFIGTRDANDFIARTNNVERMRITSAGRIGIGENNPTNATLEVNNNLIVGNTFTGGTATAQPGGITVEGRSIVGEDNFFYNVDKFVVYGNTTWIPGQVTNGDNGNGLIYAINAYTSGGRGLYAEDNDGGTGLEISVNDTTATPTGATGVNATENSGIGTAIIGTSANATDRRGIGVQGVEGTNTGWAVLASGDLNVTGGTFNISDKKLKRNIQPINDAIALVNKLNPTTYSMKWDDNRYKNAGFSKTKQIGFIAQEVETVLPYIIKESKIPLNNHNYSKEDIQKNPKLANIKKEYEEIKSINYIQLIPLLTQAIKELSTANKELEARITQLEQK